MPITFEDGWNQLKLAKLKNVGDADNPDVKHIAYFWLAKTQMNKLMPARREALATQLVELENNTMTPAVLKALRKEARQKLGKKGKPEQLLKDQVYDIDNAIRRDKLTKPIADLTSMTPAKVGVARKNFASYLDGIHNDRLRISDRDMLQMYSGIAIRIALRAANPRFKQNTRVAAMLARAVAKSGPAVTVTQGVHQSNDPHFDVLMPGEPQQYHINVLLPADDSGPLIVHSISYMKSLAPSDGSVTVLPDTAALADVHTAE